MLRKPLSFLKKDLLMEVSYKFSFVLQFASIFFSVVMFYFVGKLLGEAPTVQKSISEYGGNYFAFVLIGIAFQNYLSVGLGSFANNIRAEQMIGTLEAMLVTPTRLATIVLSSSQWSFAFTSIRVAIYLVLGGVFFGVSFTNATILPTLTALLLTVIAFSSLGIISASFIMVFKKGDPIAWATPLLQRCWAVSIIRFPSCPTGCRQPPMCSPSLTRSGPSACRCCRGAASRTSAAT